MSLPKIAVSLRQIANELETRTAAVNVRQLEKDYKVVQKRLKGKNPKQLKDDELRVLLAYEALDDGAPKVYVEQVLNKKKTRQQMLSELEPYGY